MKLQARIAATAALTIAAAAALAHGGATGIVKERMDAMSQMADAMKALAPMMQGTAAYDAAAVRDGARVIASHAGDALTTKFPAGSGGMPSEAKPEVWEDWEAFASYASQLEALAAGLELAADNGPGGAPAQGGMMGGGMMGGGMMGG